MKEGKVYLHIIGKAAHAQEPRNGQNAATYMATFLQQFDFGGAAANFIKFTADYLHQDSRMKAFGVAYTDEIMGDLTMNSGSTVLKRAKVARSPLISVSLKVQMKRYRSWFEKSCSTIRYRSKA